jgi:hypothetical protein
MAHKLTWSDRLRIERVVWMLDQRLYDIPRGWIGTRSGVRCARLSRRGISARRWRQSESRRRTRSTGYRRPEADWRPGPRVDRAAWL